MMGGYLQRLVESGMTSLSDLSGSIHHAPVARDSEKQQGAAPFEGDEAVPELTRALPEPPGARPDPRPLAVSREERIEERLSHATVPPRPQDARGGDEDAASLKDAGIRSVRDDLSRDEALAAKGANRQRPVLFEASVSPLDRITVDSGMNPQRATPTRGRASAADRERHGPQPGVPGTRETQWARLKDRLLIEHFPGTYGKGPGDGAELDVSPPTNTRSNRDEIVIELLEVVVAAPHPASLPPAPGPSAQPPRSGAWSVATRRHLGRL